MDVNFDDYSQDYKEVLNSSLLLLGENGDYYDIIKLNCLKQWGCDPETSSMILDYGCGIGSLTHLISETYSSSIIDGFDVSPKSIEWAQKQWINHKNLTFTNDLSSLGQYDLITVANVFHHIKPEIRQETLQQLHKLLKPNGFIAIFEHNPFNPLTRYIVKTCPFDRDAELLSLRQLGELGRTSGLEVHMKRYITFFPKLLEILYPIEIFLGLLPLGAQYMILFKQKL
jgi:SAM-dependent methyltransferase